MIYNLYHFNFLSFTPIFDKHKIITWIARKVAMHIQFPIKHKTPRCQPSSPTFSNMEKNHPTGSGWPLALISLAIESTSLWPKRAGPRNRTINIAPETHTRVPPTFTWPSVFSKFTLSVLQEQVHMGNWTKRTRTKDINLHIHT